MARVRPATIAMLSRRQTSSRLTRPATPIEAAPACRVRWFATDFSRKAGAISAISSRRADVVMVQARRPSGRLFDLTIDRCSGEVVDARPVFGPRVEPGAYAYGGYGGYGYGPRRFWPRPY